MMAFPPFWQNGIKGLVGLVFKTPLPYLSHTQKSIVFIEKQAGKMIKAPTELINIGII